MSKTINKPSARDNPDDSPYEGLCGKPLSEAEEAEMNFNLVNFVETLIAMDRQQQAWLENQKEPDEIV
jgi:hypothetical protein